MHVGIFDTWYCILSVYNLSTDRASLAWDLEPQEDLCHLSYRSVQGVERVGDCAQVPPLKQVVRLEDVHLHTHTRMRSLNVNDEI
jgi:hypothetical protein